MRIINKKYLLIILLVGIVLTGVIITKPKENVKLDNVILKQEISNRTFAMYKESEEGYTEVEGTQFPEGYVLNLSESKCIDNNGAEIKDALQEEGGNISLRTNKSSYCYLYFDLNPLVKKLLHDKNEDTEINYVGDLWRYQGTDNVNNWICFGTEENCSTTEEDIDKYMYRIIGITSDGSLKLIKETFVNEDNNILFQWNNKNSQEDCGPSGELCNWPNSMIYKRLNGISNGEEKGANGNSNIFINSEYYDYLSNNSWLYIIKDTNWKYGTMDLYMAGHGSEFVYKLEQEWQDTITAKIGILNISDYYFSADKNGNCYETVICQNYSWILKQLEWLMIYNGYIRIYGGYYAEKFGASGNITHSAISNDASVRPVFYLNSNMSLKEDSIGTKENPYIINIEA